MLLCTDGHEAHKREIWSTTQERLEKIEMDRNIGEIQVAEVDFVGRTSYATPYHAREKVSATRTQRNQRGQRMRLVNNESASPQNLPARRILL